MCGCTSGNPPAPGSTWCEVAHGEFNTRASCTQISQIFHFVQFVWYSFVTSRHDRTGHKAVQKRSVEAKSFFGALGAQMPSKSASPRSSPPPTPANRLSTSPKGPVAKGTTVTRYRCGFPGCNKRYASTDGECCPSRGPGIPGVGGARACWQGAGASLSAGASLGASLLASGCGRRAGVPGILSPGRTVHVACARALA